MAISNFELELYHRCRMLARSLERQHPEIYSLLGYSKGLQHLEDSSPMSAVIDLLTAPAPALPDRDPHVYGA